jgi:hypothetical protein
MCSNVACLSSGRAAKNVGLAQKQLQSAGNWVHFVHLRSLMRKIWELGTKTPSACFWLHRERNLFEVASKSISN